jgi:hypothetical protein
MMVIKVITVVVVVERERERPRPYSPRLLLEIFSF